MVKVKYEGVTAEYGKKTVIRDFSLEINESEILGIVGPSGCGKTTLVRALCGFLNPSEGNIYLNGELVYSKDKRVNIAPERRGIGIVFQDYAVWPHMTVEENVAYPLKKRKIPKDEIHGRVHHALEQVNMLGYEKYIPSQLSGGQQQRVAIARALTSSEDLIVMDEPITNLDAKLREGMLVEIRMMQQKLGTTIIYITHDQEAALQLCDRVVIMQPDGSICQIGTDEEIIEQPANRFTFSFIGVSNFIPVTQKDDGWYLHLDEDILYTREKPEKYLDEASCVIGIRPMDMVFDEEGLVPGVITQAVFLGNMYNYFVKIGGQEFRVQRSTLDSLDGRVYQEGDHVRLTLLNEKYYPHEKGGATA